MGIIKNAVAILGTAFISAVGANIGFDGGEEVITRGAKGVEYIIFKAGKAPVVRKGLFKGVVNPVTGEFIKLSKYI